MSKTLYVMRHGKSSWDDEEQPDVERPLAPRGERAARRIAAYLANAEPRPALVLCSSATRAVQTYEAIASRLEGSPTVQIEERLYAASAEELLDRLRELPEKVKAVLLIGHNPGLQDLLVELCGEGDLREQLIEGFPTGALATVRVRRSWAELGASTSTVKDMLLPRSMVP